MKDWTGNKTTTFVQLGASSHSEKEREQNEEVLIDVLENTCNRLQQTTAKI